MAELGYVTVVWNDGLEEEFIVSRGATESATRSIWYYPASGGMRIVPLNNVRYIDERTLTDEEKQGL